MTRLVYIFLLLSISIARAQFAPPANMLGTTAIYKDSTIFVEWANSCKIFRGFQDISNTSLGFTTVGDSTMALGVAGTNGVISLGDAGEAILTFEHPVLDGTGWDFAVFENSFSADFLEFAFVEVSSDGVNYFRFPATSNIPNTIQTGPFDLSDASLVNNLAGKYEANFGTPFDLNELSGINGLDISAITHIKIIDVIGSIQNAFSSMDHLGNIINDPWPTPFPSSGFDLDAIGVIHMNTAPIGINEKVNETIELYPNPCTSSNKITLSSNETVTQLFLVDLIGNEIRVSFQQISPFRTEIYLPENLSGIFYLKTEIKNNYIIKKLILQ